MNTQIIAQSDPKSKSTRHCELRGCLVHIDQRRHYCNTHQSVDVRNRVVGLERSRQQYRFAAIRTEQRDAAFFYAYYRGWIRDVAHWDKLRAQVFVSKPKVDRRTFYEICRLCQKPVRNTDPSKLKHMIVHASTAPRFEPLVTVGSHLVSAGGGR